MDDDRPDADNLVKVTVNLTHHSYDALLDGARLSGDSKTETINRALQVYAKLLFVRRLGDRVFLGRHRLFSREPAIDWFKELHNGR